MKNRSISNSFTFLLLGCIGMLLSLGGFWDYSKNQNDYSRLSHLNQGFGTCWSRISQTFTAIMIKDIQSPYLDKGFMSISNECLSEVKKDTVFLRNYLGKNFDQTTRLISEVNWFHELVMKTHTPMIAGKVDETGYEKLMERYTRSENLKLELNDAFEESLENIQKLSFNDRYIIGLGLLMIISSFLGLSLLEYKKNKLTQSIEKEALNLLSSGDSKLGAMVDSLLLRALTILDMKVASQVFRDYHEDLLELVSRKSHARSENLELKSILDEKKLENQSQNQTEEFPKCSLKEIIVSIENLHTKDDVQASDFRDVHAQVEYEACEQIFNSIVNKLKEKRTNQKRVLISNQIHSDKVVVNFFVSGAFFSASELEYMESSKTFHSDFSDMNLMVLKELLAESKATVHFENKTDKQGQIIGATIRLVVKRASKEKSKLVSLVRGKKKDISKELMN